MKKFTLFLLGIFTLLTLNSCCLAAYAQTDDDSYYGGVDYTTIVTYGTPFYVNGVISYYLYNNLYYYPYRWNNIWYFHPFRSVQPHGFIYRPNVYHRPNSRLGDVNHHFQPNFGDRHINRGGGMPSSSRGNNSNFRMGSSSRMTGGGMNPRSNGGYSPSHSFGSSNTPSGGRGHFGGGHR